jgi:hypothetical protein
MIRAQMVTSVTRTTLFLTALLASCGRAPTAGDAQDRRSGEAAVNASDDTPSDTLAATATAAPTRRSKYDIYTASFAQIRIQLARMPVGAQIYLGGPIAASIHIDATRVSPLECIAQIVSDDIYGTSCYSLASALRFGQAAVAAGPNGLYEFRSMNDCHSRNPIFPPGVAHRKVPWLTRPIPAAALQPSDIAPVCAPPAATIL